ncbi:amino acid adenylation domain-containing protein, partial [Duganella sp. HSC-15S17]
GSLIGQPLPDLRAYILDAHRQPAPIGVTGELYIGGAGVARGYLNRPELTAERFIADPFGDRPDARLYRTGDLGRWLPDGGIEYLGRNDFQVKIRGFRIELGEIEARLAACAGVREAVVIAREDSPGERRLVAYLVAEAGAQESAAALDPATLRAALATRLADYMLPAAYVVLEALALTPNGKLDRNALPAPGQDAVVARRYQAPQGPAETALAAVWAELLGLEQVGRDDHFFELGGHSLMVITLIERLRRLGLSTEVRAVFEAPALHAMAAGLTTGDEARSRAAPVPPNLIGAECGALRPELLPLVALTQHEIDLIVDSVPGGAANIQDIYPLAPLQEGILFHHLLDGEGDAYLMRSTFVFDRRARLDAFLDALQSVIARHDILRSSVRWTGLSAPVQVVQRQAPLPLHTLTLDAAGDAVEQLQQRTDPRRLRLDLRRAPLIAAYVAADPHSGQWLLALLDHHIVSDNTTLGLIIAEILALLQGRADSLPPSLPYRDFIARARAVPAAAHEEYFRRRLADIDAPTAPFDLLDVRHDGSDVGETRLELDAALALRVREGARRHGVSAAVLFHTAWAQVLAQCCGRDDVVFGTVLSGRLQGADGAGQMLGMFINTLPLRISLGARPIGQVLRDSYRDLGELLSHEQASLALAQRCSGVAAPQPLFTTILNYRHNRAAAAAAQDAAAHQRDWEGMRAIVAIERTNYPVSVSVDDLGAGFALTMQCADGIDSARMAAYLLGAVETLLAALAADAGQPARTLNMLPAAERRLLLADYNDSAADSPREQLLHRLFEQQAAARPDAVALDCAGRRLSYGELDRRANGLARRLLALGVRPDDRVAICAERGVEMVLAMLAVLKAGAAYVPLDPAYPAARLDYMLADCAPAALLLQPGLQARLPASGVPLIVLDDAAMAADALPAPAVPGLHARHLANVIYTSGSTGQPKGVMVEHRNVLRLVMHPCYVHIGADDCVAHCANPAFDASTWEIWATLLHGARLLIVPPATLLDAQSLGALLGGAGVTVLHLTAGLFNQYAEPLAPLIAGLRYLLFGGEQADFNAVARVLRDSPPRHLVHCYGPTETTTFATTHAVTAGTRPLPIGRPISNTQVYILDAHGRLAPPGVAGELYIGGDGVARGYLNRRDLTAQRFVADPYSTLPGARLYRTGDLGRHLPGGAIEYLGRNDFQVKLRGYRIELGEIETALTACPGVREAVVLAREDSPGDRRLVAYLTARDGAVPDPAALRARLATLLADYMLPAAFVTLASMPLTPHGKLDRRALPAPDQGALAGPAYAAPHGAIETALAEIWQDLLGLPLAGRDDNFFALGGHSLLVIALIERLRARGLATDVGTVFSSASLAALAAAIGARQDHAAPAFVVPPNLLTLPGASAPSAEPVEEFRL